MIDYSIGVVSELNLVEIGFSSLYSLISDYHYHHDYSVEAYSIVGRGVSLVILGSIVWSNCKNFSKFSKKLNSEKKIQKLGKRSKISLNQILYDQLVLEGIRDEAKDLSGKKRGPTNLKFWFRAKMLFFMFIVTSLQNSPPACVLALVIAQLGSTAYLTRSLFRSCGSPLFSSWLACLSHLATEIALLAFSMLSGVILWLQNGSPKNEKSTFLGRVELAIVILLGTSITLEGLEFTYTCYLSLKQLLESKKKINKKLTKNSSGDLQTCPARSPGVISTRGTPRELITRDKIESPTSADRRRKTEKSKNFSTKKSQFAPKPTSIRGAPHETAEQRNHGHKHHFSSILSTERNLLTKRNLDSKLNKKVKMTEKNRNGEKASRKKKNRWKSDVGCQKNFDKNGGIVCGSINRISGGKRASMWSRDCNQGHKSQKKSDFEQFVSQVSGHLYNGLNSAQRFNAALRPVTSNKNKVKQPYTDLKRVEKRI